MTLRSFLFALAAAVFLAIPASASADFGFLGDFGTGGAGNGQFTEPTSIAVAPDGAVWIGDGLRVQKFSAAGQYLTQVQVGRFGVGSIATDAAGNLYVGNGDDVRIEKFDPNGAPVGTIGGPGEGPGQFRAICGLDLDPAGNVYVADGRGGYCDSTPRIQKFDP